VLRLTQTNYPDGGQETFTPIYTGGYFTGASLSKKISSTQNYLTTQLFDGLGRLKETQVNSDLGGTTYTDITYDAIGRKYKVWNPTRCSPAQTNCGESTWGFTTYNYDPLNRVTSVVEQDSSTASTDYSSSPCITVTDEAAKKRKSCTDGLGRMTGVWEDPSGLNYQTSYSYDALDNLLSVTQSGSRQRTFSYDSLSRLTKATNPESGTICYAPYSSGSCQNLNQTGYDANGNLITKTDARSITTTYSYDALNRETFVTHSDGSQVADITYDVCSICSPFTSSNSVGRLIRASNDVNAAKFYSYDPMGRVTYQTSWTPSNSNVMANPVSASYDLAGDLASLTYPSGRKVTYQYNNAIQPTQVRFDSYNGTSVGYNYLSAASYAPIGAPTSLTLGSGVIESASYNDRLQPCNLQAATGAFTWLNRTNNFYPTPGTNCLPGSGGNNGNVMSIADNLQANRTQTFTYDFLNRISTAQSAATSGADCWGQSFGYDAWANLLAENVTKCSGTQLSVGVNSQNRITNSGISYDASGDMLTDGVNTYTYNADSQILTLNGSGATYTYDAQGNRVRKDVSGSASTEYVYFNGQVIAEKNVSSGVWTDYIFSGSRRLASANGTNETSISNGSFEQGLTSWSTNGTLVSSAANAHSGNNYVLLSSTGAQVGAWRQTVAVNPGDQLTFGGWVYLESGTGGPIGTGGWNGWFLAVYNASGSAIAYVSPGGTITLSAWSYESSTYIVPAGAASVQLYAQVYQPTTIPTALRVDDGFLSTGTAYYHGDHLGSARALTDTGGNVMWSATYLPFGQEWNPQPTVNHYKFTGKERDSESGLDNFGARYDSSQYGRFMTPDPDSMSGLDHLDDPQSLNSYAYARNNPLLYTDPDGRNYQVCEVDKDGNSFNCGNVSDDKAFEDYAKSQGWVIKSGNLVDQSGNTVGTANWFAGGDAAAANQIAQYGPPLEFLGGIEGLFIMGPGMGMLEGTLPEVGLAGGLGLGASAREGAGTGARPSAPPNLAKLSPKIENDMAERGWTQQDIQNVYQNGSTSTAIDRTAGGQPATQYLDPATGKFIVVNNTTGNVIQVSGPGFRPNPPVNYKF
jgi:RHS repeat-associated protein